jgi:hypothetical protein
MESHCDGNGHRQYGEIGWRFVIEPENKGNAELGHLLKR